MKKKIFVRALLGAPIGLAICTVVTIIFSLIYGNGEYLAASHDLIAACSSEIQAVILQTVFSMIYGAVWGGASIIWEAESWSLLKMTLTHLAICSISTFLIAYFLQWMAHSLLGAFCFFGMFFVIYTIVWLSKYCAIKRQIEQMNSKLKEKN
ncbi:MAG: DUF3021 domain-containing protein [Lachnospiraceae bacterium]|nr:DUF3021 domain-containing protein [Lachnospiraceae bacterium]